MLAVFKRSGTSTARPDAGSRPSAADEAAATPNAVSVVAALARQASTLGREAAEVRGLLDDTQKLAQAQAGEVRALVQQVQNVVQSQDGIVQETARGREAASQVSGALAAVADEVTGIVQTLQQVSEAAGQITQIALQTRLVAFNASVEAKRAGEAGRGFGVVADAIKDLAGQVEQSSKAIASTVSQLDARITELATEITRDPSVRRPGAVHRALDDMTEGVGRIHAASENSRSVCGGLDAQIRTIESEMLKTTSALKSAFDRTETFLAVSEHLIESVAVCGVQTEDTPFIRAAQQAAGAIGALLDEALRTSAISAHDLWDEQYRPVADSAPPQHTTRFAALADRLFPAVQEPVLRLSDKVVFCIAADRNGYIACHNQQYNHPQRRGDLAWNTAHARNRRIFNDRTGLASARNRKDFLLQTYRRDMGGGTFVVMKEVAAPIRVAGRHWGGLRLAFKF